MAATIFSTGLPTSLPLVPYLYPEDEISDLPMRNLAAEITREKVFLRLHEELPYSSHVETETWTELTDGSVKIEQAIFVERDSQKKIVIGRKGETMKAISMAARKELDGNPGAQGASHPVREGARELGRRSRALSRNGA